MAQISHGEQFATGAVVHEFLMGRIRNLGNGTRNSDGKDSKLGNGTRNSDGKDSKLGNGARISDKKDLKWVTVHTQQDTNTAIKTTS